jgi:hypothetical protein
MGSPAAGGDTLPQWQVPAGWKSQPPGQMLLATFAIEDAKDGKATVTVSSFPGDVGGTLANLNRWRTQVGLPAVQAADLEKETSTLEVNGLKVTLADMLGTAVKENDTRPMRLIGAMIPRGGQTWFFKMMGDAAVTAGQKENFMAFIKSLSFDAPQAAAPAAPPANPHGTTPMGGALPAAAAMPPMGGDAAAANLPQWQAPAHWKTQAPGAMVLATFGIEDDKAGKATMTVSSFPGDVGGLLANVNRWRRQVGAAPIEAAALEKETSPLDLGGIKATLADMTGTIKTAGGNSTRLLAASIPRDGQTWFFKLMGDEPLVAKEKENFLAFLKTLKFDHAH